MGHISLSKEWGGAEGLELGSRKEVWSRVESAHPRIIGWPDTQVTDRGLRSGRIEFCQSPHSGVSRLVKESTKSLDWKNANLIGLFLVGGIM